MAALVFVWCLLSVVLGALTPDKIDIWTSEPTELYSCTDPSENELVLGRPEAWNGHAIHPIATCVSFTDMKQPTFCYDGGSLQFSLKNGANELKAPLLEVNGEGYLPCYNPCYVFSPCAIYTFLSQERGEEGIFDANLTASVVIRGVSPSSDPLFPSLYSYRFFLRGALLEVPGEVDDELKLQAGFYPTLIVRPDIDCTDGNNECKTVITNSTGPWLVKETKVTYGDGELIGCDDEARRAGNSTGQWTFITQEGFCTHSDSDYVWLQVTTAATQKT